MKNRIYELKDFYILWSTQGLSQLGSTMTNFALTLWLYQATGSALQTALLSVCSYTPYVPDDAFSQERSAISGIKRKRCWYATHWQPAVHFLYLDC